jgi:hypothetical protein
MPRSSSWCLALAAVLLSAYPCLADPVVLTGGGATLYWDGQLSSFSFTGPGTTISQDSRNPWGPTGFTVGSPVEFSGSLNPESTHGSLMTVNGTSYDNAVLVGTASFVTNSYTAAAGDSGAGDVELPLLLSGHFEAFNFGDVGGTPLFAFDVALQGVFRSGFVNVSPDTFLNRNFAATAEFTGPAGPSQTPEPGSLLLMGTPVAAIGLRRLRNRLRR